MFACVYVPLGFVWLMSRVDGVVVVIGVGVAAVSKGDKHTHILRPFCQSVQLNVAPKPCDRSCDLAEIIICHYHKHSLSVSFLYYDGNTYTKTLTQTDHEQTATR